MSPSTQRTIARTAAVLTAVAAVGLWLVTGAAYGKLNASVTNADSAGSGTLLYSHSYGTASTCTAVPAATIPSTSSFPCSGSIAPTAPTATTGAVSATDTITVKGSLPAANVTEQVSVASCAPVQLANADDSANPMLARYGTTFSPSPATPPMTGAGAITLDGASPGGYESAVVSQTQPNPALSLGNTYGLGIWFKTSSTTGGPLFGIGTSPAATTGGNDRILYMNANGTLSFIQNSSGATTTTSASYDNGAWHFAYVTMTAVSVLAGLTSTTTIYVDGTSAAAGGGTLIGYTADVGYWHAGWSPVTGLPSYFPGSLSDFVIFNSGSAPAVPSSAQRASQSAFVTWASTASEFWPLNDSGTVQFTGTYPTGTANPCGTVDLGWSFASPASCAWATSSTTNTCAATPTTTTITSAASGGVVAVASAAPRVTVTSTISTARGSGYNTSFAPGLHLYAPLTFTARAGSWTDTFTWADATSVFLA